jgi:hypothetical protein
VIDVLADVGRVHVVRAERVLRKHVLVRRGRRDLASNAVAD